MVLVKNVRTMDISNAFGLHPRNEETNFDIGEVAGSDGSSGIVMSDV